MGGELETTGADLSWAEARSALSWWLEAGVDATVQEQPRNWLKPAPAPGTEPPPAVARSNVAEPDHQTLTELQGWLASSMHLPLAATTAKRVMPSGPENAAIMLLSDAPALEDFTAGRPIGGKAWDLATRMLAAIGIAPEQAYSASLSCLHAPGSKMSPSDREACAAIARHHIRLARPRRLLLLGDGPAQALIGKLLTQARGHVHKVEGVRTVATFHPRHLIDSPSNKSMAWEDLLLLMEGES